MPVAELLFADPSASIGYVLAQSSAEAASLHGHKAKTPMLAGAIIGSIMGAAYVVGFTIYFWKRCKRKKLKRRIEQGKAEPKVQPEPKERIVIPPDPAVLLGHNKPGDVIIPDSKPHHHHHHRSKSAPKVSAEASGSTSHLVRADTAPERISDDV
ncbi:Protein kinase domain-containing protein [Mycena sanguinolenta]|uniref:Protein kinase domain-containing protein n=1 Tax=Mycena sanguinolenta TaxID=230812 RepID=A0A8H6ZF16_9AGAR|nr:Protein kinase domain-containing protein [Mycena sanguinolenta]